MPERMNMLMITFSSLNPELSKMLMVTEVISTPPYILSVSSPVEEDSTKRKDQNAGFLKEDMAVVGSESRASFSADITASTSQTIYIAPVNRDRYLSKMTIYVLK